MTDQNGGSPEEPSTILNLDELEREGGSPIPFSFMHDSRRYVMSDPQEVDWQKLILAMSNPVRFLQIVLPPDDQNQFFSSPLPTWKMNALMDAYLKHYGLPTPGELGALPR